jgi:mono/diheme cytochrome c family protein
MRILLFTLVTICCACAVNAQDAVDYAKQIKPVLQARCYACHGALKQESDLRLDTAALARKGGASGAEVLSGEPAKGELLRRVASQDAVERMPPEGEPLTPAQIELFRKWIAQGAKAPENEEPEHDPREHWAFRTPTKPPVPLIDGQARNPIDAFLAAKRTEKGLTAQGRAEPRIWLRRVYLDLTGLPPSADESNAFAADPSDDAAKAVVDHLLASPQYGERWGRHWMDVWRYSDWWGLGTEVRNSQKHIWHWRDWIIESLNADKGYDQMVREMLAADELYPNDLEKLRAGGFLARQYFIFNRTTWLDGAIEHTSKGFLGVTFNCCKCHDHKYDPFTQEDYYRYRAIFEPYQVRMDLVPGVIDTAVDGIPRPFDCNLDAATQLHIRGDDRNPDPNIKIAPGVPTMLGGESFQASAVNLPKEAVDPGLRDTIVKSYVTDAETKLDKARAAGDALSIGIASLQLDAIRARSAAQRAIADNRSKEECSALAKEAVKRERLLAIAQQEQALKAAEAAHTTGKDADKPALAKKVDEAKTALDGAKKKLETIDETFTRIPGAIKTAESNLETPESRAKPFPATSTGRRTALANWITDPKNPLAARVAVNHIWTRHFGRPLTPSLFDLGRKSAPPEHQALLDWLAIELIESGWSMKHIHRLIVMSEAYRMTSSSAGANPEALARDPENRFYWRANPVRMEAQVVRDSLLSLAGDIDLTQGGPTIEVKNDASRRRSLYFFHSHNEQHPFLETFDDASVLECYRRTESIVPQQALALENSQMAMNAAVKIAARLPAENDKGFIGGAFELLLGVSPSAQEQQAALSALAAWRALSPQAAEQARARLVLALLNHNDFVTIR